MNEILSIILLTIIFSFITTLPMSNIIFNENNLRTDKTSKLIVNYLIFLNIILILSFFNIKLNYIIAYLSFFLCVIYLFFQKKNLFQENFLFIIILSILLIIISVHISNELILYWDVEKVWLPKTILFFNEENIKNLAFLSRENYPYFGSLYWSVIWKLSMQNYEYAGRIGYVFLFLLSVLNFVNTFKTSDTNKIIIYLFFVYVIYEYWHFRGTQEILIFSLILICTKSLYQLNYSNQNKKNNFVYLFIFFLSLNLLIWSKSEGTFFAFFLILTLVFLIKTQLVYRFLILLFYCFLIIVKILVFKTYDFNILLSEDFNFFNLYDNILINISIDNILFILKHLFFSFFKFPSILLSIFFLILILKENNFSKTKFYFFFPVLNILFIFLVYLSTNKGFDHMVVTSLNRVFFESSSYFFIFILIYFNKKKITNF